MRNTMEVYWPVFENPCPVLMHRKKKKKKKQIQARVCARAL